MGWGQIKHQEAFLQGHGSGCLNSSNRVLVQGFIMVVVVERSKPAYLKVERSNQSIRKHSFRDTGQDA